MQSPISQFNSENSAGKPNLQYQPNLSELNQKKSPLKIYNSMYNNFDYEYHTKQKRITGEMIADRSTPSNVSEQSIIVHNDVYHIIPAVRELILLAECKDKNYISRHEAFGLLKKLRIAQTYTDARKAFKTLRFTENNMSIEEFFMFFTSDVKTLDYRELTREELILKFGSEIYRAVGRENCYMEIKDVVNYIKDHNTLGFDLTQMLELFDFYKSEITGTLKSRLTILSFFNKNALALQQVFTPEFVQRLLQIMRSFRQDHLTSTQQSNPNLIKLYDTEKGAKGGLDTQNLHTKLSRAITFNKKESEVNNIDDKILNDKDLKMGFRDPELEDVFFEVQPKNKGWLMRKSKKHNNKWAMVFCEISDERFFSVKPTILKKSIEIKNIEMHKCNFLELMNRLDFTTTAESRKTHRRTGSQGLKADRGTSTESKFPNNTRQATQQNTQPNNKLDFCFFVLDSKTQKPYLIRSPENVLIGSIIHFYLHKDKYFNLYSGIINPMLCAEPEYSGVIEIATCKKKSINRYHSTLKSYSFKKQFLIIKNGKFNIYEMKIKDNLNLCDFEVHPEINLDILPQTNPFIFSLEKLDSQKPKGFSTNIIKEEDDDCFASKSIHAFKREQFVPSFVNANNNYDSKKKITTEPEYAELVLTEEKKAPTKNYFQSFFQSLVGGGKKKKPEKVTLACDTELKRRQWILTLNYFIANYMKFMARSKIITTKESILMTHEDPNVPNFFSNHNGKASFHTEVDASNADKRKKKNKSSLNFRNHVQANPDFYDVYNGGTNNSKDEEKTEKVVEEDIAAAKRNALPLITEPDASNPLDSEEVLLTFTQFNAENLPLFLKNNPNAGIQINFEDPAYLFPNEIKTLSEVELWQKFILFFMKENHVSSNFDLQEESSPSHNNTQARFVRAASNFSQIEAEFIEDEPLVRMVLTDSYKSKNKQF